MACLESRVRKKQLDYMMAPRDLVFTTWYLNKTRIRTWDHFPVVVKIEKREMRVRKGKKGWAGWTPVSEDEERKFKELCLCPDEVFGNEMMRLSRPSIMLENSLLLSMCCLSLSILVQSIATL